VLMLGELPGHRRGELDVLLADVDGLLDGAHQTGLIVVVADGLPAERTSTARSSTLLVT
jgi:hypothetical protein